jgi:hypothetical protein
LQANGLRRSVLAILLARWSGVTQSGVMCCPKHVGRRLCIAPYVKTQSRFHAFMPH